MHMLLDQYGKPLTSDRRVDTSAVISQLRHEVRKLKASYDAAADGNAFVNHWANADSLSPDAANSYAVRKKLRNRSRYEVIANNPYLKGTVLTICNDFVGSGPKLRITDARISKEARRFIKRSYRRWAKKTKYRQKLWRLRMAKLVDGEGFKVAIDNRRIKHPVKLDFMVIEADRVTSLGMFNSPEAENEVDGVRFDGNGDPTSYYVLDAHPGGFFPSLKGRWISADKVTHWFRKDRGWLRGIPETTASLPLCALLRRYTLAVVKAAETGADFAAVLESEAPAAVNPWDTALGADSPFDTFPIEQGMFMTLPFGYKLSQLRAEQPVQTYDTFVQSILGEICRPLLAPLNVASGTSKDSNMASGVLDTHIYKGAQRSERLHCDEDVVEEDFELWWYEFVRSPEIRESPEIRQVLTRDTLLNFEPPDFHIWWDRVGIDHTDPTKVANALKVAQEKGFLLDEDIQEEYQNRDVDEWREAYEEQQEWRSQFASEQTDENADGSDSGEDEDKDEEDEDKEAAA